MLPGYVLLGCNLMYYYIAINTKFFNELQHTTSTGISFIVLKELLIPHYIDEDNEPLEDEMVELAIRFLSGIFYR